MHCSPMPVPPKSLPGLRDDYTSVVRHSDPDALSNTDEQLFAGDTVTNSSDPAFRGKVLVSAVALATAKLRSRDAGQTKKASYRPRMKGVRLTP